MQRPPFLRGASGRVSLTERPVAYSSIKKINCKRELTIAPVVPHSGLWRTGNGRIHTGAVT